MKIAVAQLACLPGDVQANIARLRHWIGEARAAGCQLVVFPEMCDTGYLPQKFGDWALPWPGLACDAVAAAAEEHSIGVIAGLSERVGESVFNSAAYFNPSGQLAGKYRKTHLYSPPPASECQYCIAGNDFSIVALDGLRIGLSICYDLRFPELYRLLTLAGAQVLVNIAAWPVARPTHWDYLTRARAIENQAFVVAANRTGSDGSFQFLGHSRILSPMGEVLAELTEGEGLAIADLDLSLIDSFRATVPALADRRPELYRPISESNKL